MERDTILIIEGGGMLGVFGAGVVTAFEEADIYPRLQSVYGTSAGSHDAAYFLARQSHLGSSIYYDDLSGDDFVRPRVFFRYLWDIIVSKMFRRHPVSHILNLDMLEQIEATTKHLDVEAIRRQPIGFHVLVYDMDTRALVIRDGTKQTLRVIKASSAIPPYYTRPVDIDGRRYVDGGLAPRTDIIRLIEQHANKRIVYIINNPKTLRAAFVKLPLFLLEFLLVFMTYGIRLAIRSFVHELTFMTAGRLRRYPYVSVIVNTLPHRHNFLSRKQLLTLYEHGLAKGRLAAAALAK